MYGQKKLDCIDAAAARQRVAYDKAKAAAAASPHADKYGRKSAALTFGGIAPAIEAKLLPGDKIKAGKGLNNISINYRNSGGRAWTSFQGLIYTPVYDAATRHYSGFDKLQHPVLHSAKTKDPGERSGLKIKLGGGINFDEPLDVRIRLETEYGNSFWTEFTAKVEGNETSGYTIPVNIIFDHYSYTVGKDDAPITPLAKPAAAAAVAAPVSSESAPPATAPSPAPTPAPAKQASDFGWAPVHGNKTTLNIGGISPKLASALASDPLLDKKRNLKVFIKNEGDERWSRMKYETYRGVEPAKMGISVDFYEVDTLTFDKPVVLRVQAYTQGKKLFWTETTRTRADMGKPLVMDQYGAEP